MRLDLLNGEFMCCGALCDKYKAQACINKMQRLIDGLEELLKAPESDYKQLIDNLRILHKDL
jgi:hypothetical protein